jgi:hypothetical protein
MRFPPTLRHALFLAVIFAAGGVERLIHDLPTPGWALLLAAQVLAGVGAVFTDAPGTAARLAAARSQGLISGAATGDKANEKTAP